jgi:hypothetical protein
MPSTMSLALTAKVAVAPAALVASTAMSPGTVRVGGVVSCTKILKLALAVLLFASWSVQATVVWASSGTGWTTAARRRAVAAPGLRRRPARSAS